MITEIKNYRHIITRQITKEFLAKYNIRQSDLHIFSQAVQNKIIKMFNESLYNTIPRELDFGSKIRYRDNQIDLWLKNIAQEF